MIANSIEYAKADECRRRLTPTTAKNLGAAKKVAKAQEFTIVSLSCYEEGLSVTPVEKNFYHSIEEDYAFVRSLAWIEQPLSVPQAEDFGHNVSLAAALQGLSQITVFDAIKDRLHAITQDDEDYDEEFKKPTHTAIGVAHEWLLATALVLQNHLPQPSISPDGEGGIRIEWFRTNGSVRLVIAAEEGGLSYVHQRNGKTSSLRRLSELTLDFLAAQLKPFVMHKSEL